MKRLVAVAVLAVELAGPARGQSLPAPQFATPAVGDSSARAATTAWVRSQNLLSATSDLSLATVRPTGATVARTQGARAADTFNVLDYGAVADGATDIGPALAAIAGAMGSAARANVIYFPAGSYRLATPVTFNGVAPILQGQGFAQGPFQAGWTGTWIKIDTAGATPITFSGTNARGARVRDLAFYEVHSVPAAGWAPNANDYVFRILNALGEVAFDNVLFAGVNRGIYADNSGRLAIKDVQGQFYTTGIEIDDCYDIPRIDRLHAWTFATSSPFVVSYQEAHENTVLLRRVDGIFIGDLFTLGAYAAIHMTSGANGVTTKAYVDNLYADFVNYGILVDGAGSDLQVANMTTQNNDQTNSGTTLPAGYGVWINTTGVSAQIGNLYSKLTAGPAVEVDGNANRVNIANLRANTYGTPGAGTPAINVADSGTNPSNQVYVGNKEQLQGTSPLVLFNAGSNGGRQRFVMMNDVGGANPNEARGYSAGPGGAPQLAAIGGDPNIDLYLNGKGTSGVRLQSSGQTVLRADNLNASTDDILLRGGAGAMNWIAEGGETSIDLDVTPKGPTGGVRLQANGATVLRVDNPTPGSSDLLVRSGTAVMSLTVEDAAASANLVLNPKGAGLVSVGNCPAQTDNSANLACTSWVKTYVAGLSLGGGGISALTGDVTASGSGSVAATLASVGTAGSYSKVTTDAKGRVVSGSALAAADVTGALGYAPLAAASPQATGTLNVAGANSLALAGAATGTAPTITAIGGDASVDLALAASGAAGSARLLANGATVLRAANPGPGNSDLLVQPGAGIVALTVESAATAAGLALAPKGAGTVTAPTPAASDNSTTVATTAFVKSLGYATGASLGPLASAAAVASAPLVGTTAGGLLSPVALGAGLAQVSGALAVSFGTIAGTAAQGNDPRIVGAAAATSPAFTGGSMSLASAAGAAQTGAALLVASSSSTAAVRLTQDGNPAGAANCVNLPANSALNVFVDVVGLDVTTGGSASRYRLLDLLMLKGATNAATQLVNGASNAAANGTLGSVTGATYSTTADTANGCLNLSVTPPNSDTWHWAATARTTRVQ